MIKGSVFLRHEDDVIDGFNAGIWGTRHYRLRRLRARRTTTAAARAGGNQEEEATKSD
jgi:hypothetical protein